jgi:hypothetical protein
MTGVADLSIGSRLPQKVPTINRLFDYVERQIIRGKMRQQGSEPAEFVYVFWFRYPVVIDGREHAHSKLKFGQAGFHTYKVTPGLPIFAWAKVSHDTGSGICALQK